MDFLYRNIHMEQKKWEVSTQITIEEDINIPELKGDCLTLLLKDSTLHIEETRVGRDQVICKGSLQYQILYETGNGCLEQLCGSIPFEESMNVNGAMPGELAAATGVVEDFKISMINTRKIALQSVVMLHVHMHQLAEEEWTDDVANAGPGLEKLWEEKDILQLCQKKTDVFRVKEEVELPGGYPAVQNLLWKQVSLSELEYRPMDDKISLKGELSCFFLYIGQGAAQPVKWLQKKVPFHGMIECSACKHDTNVSALPTLNSYTVEVRQDLDGEDRVFFVEAVLDLQIRVYSEEHVAILKDIYSTEQEMSLENKVVHAPVLHLAQDGKCKIKQSHRLKEGSPKAIQILQTCGTVFPDRTAWEEGKLMLSGSVHGQILYLGGEESMPYAVSECEIPYSMEMEGYDFGPGIGAAIEKNISRKDISEGAGGHASRNGIQTGACGKPTILVEPRLEQLETQLVDSEEMELKGIVAFSVLVFDEEAHSCIGSGEAKPLDKVKFAALPGMVMCFAEADMPLWEYGKRYYMPVGEIKKLNGMTGDTLKAGEGVLLVKGAREG